MSDGLFTDSEQTMDYNGILTQNRFQLNGAKTNADNKETVSNENLVIVNRKRLRKSTGDQSPCSISDIEYENLSIDGKLSVMFQQNKGISLKVDECLSLSSKVNSIVISLDDHDLRIKRLEYKAIDLEARSRRNNLLFGGIPEQKY